MEYIYFELNNRKLKINRIKKIKNGRQVLELIKN